MQYRKRPVLKNESFMVKYPKLFGVCFLTVCIGMLFSHPIYNFYMDFKLYMKERELTKKYQSKSKKLEEE